MNRRNLTTLACAALVGAAIAFPAGVFFGGRDAMRQNDRPATQRDNAPVKADVRNVFSPQIYNDPYVQNEQRKVVEELEAQCRHAGEHCAEAKAARRWLNEKH